jgi:Lrp/AsnC family leucine-responsive transcriptional regulator
MAASLDPIDRKILALIQRDSRLTNAAIAVEVGMKAPSVFERIRKLEQRGIIKGYHAHVDPAALGKTLTAFIRLNVIYDSRHNSGIDAVIVDPDVLECYSVAGEDCFLIKTKVASPEELEALIHRIRGRMSMVRSVTMIVLSTLKEDAPINVADAAPAPKPETRRASKARRNRRSN